MSVEDDTRSPGAQEPMPVPLEASPAPGSRVGRRNRAGAGPRPRIRKRRVLFILSGFIVLAVISTLFGMLTAMTSDLPKLENRAEFHSRVDSELYSAGGKLIGTLAPPNKAMIDRYRQISPNMVNAIVSVEEKHFWTDPGISLRGLARAFLSDATGGPKEGASTIPEEFVKNVLNQENDRTVFEKLREAGVAFQLVHRWKRTRIMDQYLNTIYFGNGAYGIEAAARTYFGWDHGYDPGNPGAEGKNSCGDPDPAERDRPSCASELTPAQSALLAGMVANPYEFDPVLHPHAAFQRRQLVLQDMLAQHYITRQQYRQANATPLPTRKQIQQPQEPAAAPYFVSWVRPLIINSLEHEGLTAKQAQYQAFYGGLKIKLSLNLKMQDAAQEAVDQEFPKGSHGPTASLVAIDNKTGEVRAMVSGDGDYAASPFNLATLGYRQPGSSFKMFTLAAALSTGKYSASSVFDSKSLRIPFQMVNGYPKETRTGPDHFTVHNFGNEYTGPTTLATATATSDNSVFSQLGMAVGTKAVKHYAQLMGIRSKISTYPAMILGGLSQGVSALDMAHAYETAATGGLKIYNPTLGDYNRGPIGIASISGCKPCEEQNISNSKTLKRQRVLSPEVASTIDELLHGPVDDPSGTGTAAAIPGVDVVGKTGTTSNYVDAWFVGWTPQMTVAVWVGYAGSGKAMLHNYGGGPVEGGSYPAIIWHNFMVKALQIMANSGHGSAPPSSDLETSTAVTEVTPTTESTTAPSTDTVTQQTQSTSPPSNAPTAGGGQTTNGDGGTSAPTQTPTTPQTTQPATPPPPATTTPATPPAAGGSGSSTTSGGTGL